jgi:hypothetical protein
MSSVQPSGGYPGFNLISSTYVANGFNPSTSSSVNLPLILGITIPVGIIIIVVCVILFVKCRAKDDSSQQNNAESCDKTREKIYQ